LDACWNLLAALIKLDFLVIEYKDHLLEEMPLLIFSKRVKVETELRMVIFVHTYDRVVLLMTKYQLSWNRVCLKPFMEKDNMEYLQMILMLEESDQWIWKFRNHRF
jgi:hypothetical protein